MAVGVQEFKIGFEETNADALASSVVIFIDFVPYFAEIKVLGWLQLRDNLVQFDTGVEGFSWRVRVGVDKIRGVGVRALIKSYWDVRVGNWGVLVVPGGRRSDMFIGDCC